jgi:hypothetical protein
MGRRRSAWWEWLPAAAAAAIALTFYALSAPAVARLAPQLSSADRQRDAEVAALAAELGGGPLATFQAERSVEVEEPRIEDAP